MLLWESIRAQTQEKGQAVRLPGDNRCTVITRRGTRCKGRAYNGGRCCYFHDPAVDRTALRSRVPGRTAYHMDGIASRLTTRRGITQALERLYNDTEMGIVPAEVGLSLFGMLDRMLQMYYESRPKRNPTKRDRSRAAKLLRQLAKRYIHEQGQARQVVPKARAVREAGSAVAANAVAVGVPASPTPVAMRVKAEPAVRAR
jgi:hypothetical protein